MGIRLLNKHARRVETGPVQFGDDWPGLFIRGDDCAHYMLILLHVINDMPDGLNKVIVESLIDLLAAPLHRKPGSEDIEWAENVIDEMESE